MTTVASSGCAGGPGPFPAGCDVNSGIGTEDASSQDVDVRPGVHAHHRQHWADGGPTDLDNLILLCGFHHRFVHEHGWTIQQDDDGKPIFRRPDGQVYPPPRHGLDPRLRKLVRT
jgi:hypothetical protein